ncbi:OPT superfamily oligopeptide transporter [Aulographum hederae CBS 113979]|uniref:OPT superfamily oligopeptide transporter n=1 Tax=Aulographum hederae CBS 113979 TaxID=1176131 RepID=A0A6G1HFZ8_9PEZI|nr:OPT superfamily oligopeptide transporter [Aulographum hederae CBS 113979]
MAPDRGPTTSSPPPSSSSRSRRLSTASNSSALNILDHLESAQHVREQREQSARDDAYALLAERANDPRNFTIRGVVVGLLLGVVICFSNMYFGLQTGWVSSLSMPSALMGFAIFKGIGQSGFLKTVLSGGRGRWREFTPVENVLVQSVAGSVGTMPLGCGFVGVVPALEFLLKKSEGGPLHLGLGKLVVFALGICFFGVVFAVPLRREVIIREKLKFPSGTATALMIGVLHGEKAGETGEVLKQDGLRRRKPATVMDGDGDTQGLLARSDTADDGSNLSSPYPPDVDLEEMDERGEREEAYQENGDWKARIKLLVVAFVGSALYTVVSYFIPQLHRIPILGTTLASNWLWTLNPSPAYVGQGIIMGPATTLHMLLGAIIGWGILSPLAKHNGWAPGPVSDWATGSKGWIVWISLAIMLSDSIISLGWLILRPLVLLGRRYAPKLQEIFRETSLKDIITGNISSNSKYRAIGSGSESEMSAVHKIPSRTPTEDIPEADAPPEHLIGTKTTIIGLVLSLAVCIAAVHYTFASLIPIPLTLLALLLALLLSIMGVRALGETDLNPVSGISKLTQLVFAFVVPSSNPNAVIINLIAGALSESGALQAGDLLQDLKTGHLLGAAPNAQFWGQLIGSAVGAVLSAVVYKLYTNVYEIPGGMFQVPTGFVWIFTARLVTGQGLPPKVSEWALGAGIIFAVLTALRVVANSRSHWKKFTPFIPGGIAVAVGMYNTPSFTLARTAGGLVNLYWVHMRKRRETPVIVLASGLILGEGLFSILNLVLASAKVPHL